MSDNTDKIFNLLYCSGSLTEAEIREELNISHGTFFSCRKQLEADGKITSFLNGRSLMYKAVPPAPPAPPDESKTATNAALAGGANDDTSLPANNVLNPENLDESAISDGGVRRLVGTFPSYQHWLNKLVDVVGNFDIDDSAIKSAIVTLKEHGGAKQNYRIIDLAGGRVTIK